jgi:hypothetical protein
VTDTDFRFVGGNEKLTVSCFKTAHYSQTKTNKKKLPAISLCLKHRLLYGECQAITGKVNLHLYHYAGNNPLKYTDPDGRKNEAALQYMNQYIVGKDSGYGYANDPDAPNSVWTPFEYGSEKIPKSLLCIEAVWAAYKNTGARTMPYGRSNAFDWFKEGGTIDVNGRSIGKSLVTNILKGERGDVVFMGEFKEMKGHAVLLDSLKVIDENTIEMKTVGAYSPNDKVGPETHTFKKNNNGQWINTTHGGNYIFRGYGQFNETQ